MHSSTKTPRLPLSTITCPLTYKLIIKKLSSLWQHSPYRVCKHQKVKIKPGDIKEGYAFAQSCFISAINIFEIVHSIDIVTRHTT